MTYDLPCELSTDDLDNLCKFLWRSDALPLLRRLAEANEEEMDLVYRFTRNPIGP